MSNTIEERRTEPEEIGSDRIDLVDLLKRSDDPDARAQLKQVVEVGQLLDETGHVYTDEDVLIAGRKKKGKDFALFAIERDTKKIYQLHGTVLNDITPQEFSEVRKNDLPMSEEKWGFFQWLGVIFSFGFWRPQSDRDEKHVARAKEATGYKLLCECGLLDTDEYEPLYGDLWQKNEEELQTYLKQPQKAAVSEEDETLRRLDKVRNKKDPGHAAYLEQCRENVDANRAKGFELLQQLKEDPFFSTDPAYAVFAKDLEDLYSNRALNEITNDQYIMFDRLAHFTPDQLKLASLRCKNHGSEWTKSVIWQVNFDTATQEQRERGDVLYRYCGKAAEKLDQVLAGIPEDDPKRKETEEEFSRLKSELYEEAFLLKVGDSRASKGEEIGLIQEKIHYINSLQSPHVQPVESETVRSVESEPVRSVESEDNAVRNKEMTLKQLEEALNKKGPRRAEYVELCRKNEQANRDKGRDLLRQFREDPLFSTDPAYTRLANDLEYYLNRPLGKGSDDTCIMFARLARMTSDDLKLIMLATAKEGRSFEVAINHRFTLTEVTPERRKKGDAMYRECDKAAEKLDQILAGIPENDPNRKETEDEFRKRKWAMYWAALQIKQGQNWSSEKVVEELFRENVRYVESLQSAPVQPETRVVRNEEMTLEQLEAAVNRIDSLHGYYVRQCRKNEQANRAKGLELLRQFRKDPLYKTDKIYPDLAAEMEYYLNEPLSAYPGGEIRKEELLIMFDRLARFTPDHLKLLGMIKGASGWSLPDIVNGQMKLGTGTKEQKEQGDRLYRNCDQAAERLDKMAAELPKNDPKSVIAETGVRRLKRGLYRAAIEERLGMKPAEAEILENIHLMGDQQLAELAIACYDETLLSAYSEYRKEQLKKMETYADGSLLSEECQSYVRSCDINGKLNTVKVKSLLTRMMADPLYKTDHVYSDAVKKVNEIMSRPLQGPENPIDRNERLIMQDRLAEFTLDQFKLACITNNSLNLPFDRYINHYVIMNKQAGLSEGKGEKLYEHCDRISEKLAGVLKNVPEGGEHAAAEKVHTRLKRLLYATALKEKLGMKPKDADTLEQIARFSDKQLAQLAWIRAKKHCNLQTAFDVLCKANALNGMQK